jgi:eukaryotic-like serine/threonine-protein kinase
MEEPIPAPPRAYLYPRISPDGTRLAMDVREQDNDIWVWDLGHRNAIRVTKGPSTDRTPVWTADGQSLFFSSDADSTPMIYRQRADGTGEPERVTQSSITQFPLSLSADGALLVFHQGAGGAQGGALMALQLDVPARGSRPPTAATANAADASATARVRAQVKTTNGEDNGDISPDGRWLVYQSNESGAWDIYVRPMRDLERGARVIVSTGGGMQPRWSRNGRELFYISPRNEMMSVPVASGDNWSATSLRMGAS